MFSGRFTKPNACPLGTDSFVSLKLLVSACLVLLYQVGVRVTLTLRPLTVLPRVYRWTRARVTAANVWKYIAPVVESNDESEFSESDIGLRHKHLLSCIFTVSRLLVLEANSCGHCLDMPVENELVGCCRPFTSNILKLLQYKFDFIHTEYSQKIHWARLQP